MGLNAQVEEAAKCYPFQKLLYEHMAKHEPGMTAEEFMSSMAASTVANITARASINLGMALGKKMGLRSKTVEKMESDASPVVSFMAVMCGMAANGIQSPRTELAEDEGAIIIEGFIPSSPYHMEGKFQALIVPSSRGSSITVTIVYFGALFAMGAGWRLFGRVSKSFYEVLPSATIIENQLGNA